MVIMKKGDKITVWYMNDNFIDLEGEVLDIFDDGGFSVKQETSSTVFPIIGPGNKKNKYRISLNNTNPIFTYPRPLSKRSFIDRYKYLALGILMLILWACAFVYPTIRPLFK